MTTLETMNVDFNGKERQNVTWLWAKLKEKVTTLETMNVDFNGTCKLSAQMTMLYKKNVKGDHNKGNGDE